MKPLAGTVWIVKVLPVQGTYILPRFLNWFEANALEVVWLPRENGFVFSNIDDAILFKLSEPTALAIMEKNLDDPLG